MPRTEGVSCHRSISHRRCTLPASVSPLVRRCWHRAVGTLSTAQPPAAQHYHGSGPTRAAGCRARAAMREGCCPESAAAPGSEQHRWHSPVPSVEEGAGTQQPCRADMLIPSLLPAGQASPHVPCSLESTQEGRLSCHTPFFGQFPPIPESCTVIVFAETQQP